MSSITFQEISDKHQTFFFEAANRVRAIFDLPPLEKQTALTARKVFEQISPLKVKLAQIDISIVCVENPADNKTSAELILAIATYISKNLDHPLFKYLFAFAVLEGVTKLSEAARIKAITDIKVALKQEMIDMQVKKIKETMTEVSRLRAKAAEHPEAAKTLIGQAAALIKTAQSLTDETAFEHLFPDWE